VTEAEVAARIEAYIRAQFNVSDHDGRFHRGADLFEGGYVDSVGVVELLEYVQGEFDVEIPEDDLLSDEFSRIDGIARLVCGLRR
jgi:acyl carrier protein